MLTRLKNLFLDLLFPTHCISCGSEDTWFCLECSEKIQLKTTQHCPHCWCKSAGGKTCPNCIAKTALTGLRVAASYEANPELAQIIKQFKYKFSEPLATTLGRLLTRTIRQTSYTDERIVTFVPLHYKRQNWRGFNQAELLTDIVGKELELPIKSLLIRTRNTPPQAQLNRTDRLTNLENAFTTKPNIALQNKTILLIDDIASTGSSLNECAKALKSAGAKTVWGLVLARG